MSKLKTPTNTNGFSTVPGSQMGTKSRAVLECLRKHGWKNRLDLEMLTSYSLKETISRLERIAYIAKVTYGSATGCYEITRQGRAALGESLTLATPEVIKVCNATMPKGVHYDPSIHSVSRIGLARA